MVISIEVLELSAADAFAWFPPFAEDQALPPSLELALSRRVWRDARRKILDADSLAWALISTTTYDCLARHAHEGSFDASSMYCRIAMIYRHGIREDDAVLDRSIVLG